jgi:hypothetical protein
VHLSLNALSYKPIYKWINEWINKWMVNKLIDGLIHDLWGSTENLHDLEFTLSVATANKSKSLGLCHSGPLSSFVFISWPNFKHCCVRVLEFVIVPILVLCLGTVHPFLLAGNEQVSHRIHDTHNGFYDL